MHQLIRKRNNTMFALHPLPIQTIHLSMTVTHIRPWETVPFLPVGRLLFRICHQFIGHKVDPVQLRQAGVFLAIQRKLLYLRQDHLFPRKRRTAHRVTAMV
jgi:hypothetical protein